MFNGTKVLTGPSTTSSLASSLPLHNRTELADFVNIDLARGGTSHDPEDVLADGDHALVVARRRTGEAGAGCGGGFRSMRGDMKSLLF